MKLRNQLRVATLSAFAIVCFSQTAMASVSLDDTLVATQPNFSGSSSTIWGAYLGDDYQTNGATFSPDASGALSRVGASLWKYGSPSNSWTIRMMLFETDTDSLPTTQIGSAELTVGDIPMSGYTYFDFSSLGIQLAANTRYAYLLELPEATGHANSVYARNEMDPDDCDEYSLSGYDGRDVYTSDHYVPKYEVYAVVPEPASLGLFGIGGLLAMIRRR